MLTPCVIIQSFMLSVPIKPIMLSVPIKPIMLSVIKVSVVMLNVIMVSVVMQNVVGPSWGPHFWPQTHPMPPASWTNGKMDVF
jgi:hypothetical protein